MSNNDAARDGVPGASPHDGPCLVVGYDHDAVAHGALLTAIGLAGRMDAFVHVVHVRTPEDYTVVPDAVVWQLPAGDEQQFLAERARSALSEAGVRGGYGVCEGAAASELQTAADQCDALMIVVGTRTAPLEHLVRGSTAGALERRSDRPLLIVPAHEP